MRPASFTVGLSATSGYTAAWTGTQAAGHTRTGYAGPVAYTTTRSGGGPFTGRETGVVSGATFARTETHSGTYSLAHTDTYAGGSGTRTGTGGTAATALSTGSQAANGQWMAGTVDGTHSLTDTYSGGAAYTQGGVVESGTEAAARTTTTAASGHEVSGPVTRAGFNAGRSRSPARTARRRVAVNAFQFSVRRMAVTVQKLTKTFRPHLTPTPPDDNLESSSVS